MLKSLHILHLPKWYPNSEDPQLGVFVQKQIHAASLYCDQSVLYIKSDESLDQPYLLEKKETKNVLEVSILYKKSSLRARQFFLLNSMYELGIKEIENLKGIPDILHVHNLITPAIWANKYAKKKKLPWILSEHWSGYTSNSGVFKSKMPWEKKLWHWYSEKAAYCISVSTFLKEALQSNRIGKNHKVIPNVVDGEIVSLAREDSEERMLIVSDMVDEVKNVSGSLRAFSKAYTLNEKLRLWIVGGGEDLNYLKELSIELDLRDKVKFFGRLANEEVIKIYRDIDFVLVNSRIETFSVVAAESLIAGKPVISTRCGGVEEFMDADKGILISIDDETELLEAINTMSKTYKNYDPHFLSTFAQEKFSTKSIGEALYELYQSLVK